MTRKKVENQFPPGWNEERVRAVIEHYENQTGPAAVAEDEAALASPTMMAVPRSLVPEVREVIASYERDHKVR